MIKKFVSRSVSAEDNIEEGCLTIAMADDEKEPRDYIIFQGLLAVDEQDVELGLAGYYFEVDGQGFCGYNACDKIVLNRSYVVICISKKATCIYPKFEKIIVYYDLSDLQFINLANKFSELFKYTSDILIMDK